MPLKPIQRETKERVRFKIGTVVPNVSPSDPVYFQVVPKMARPADNEWLNASWDLEDPGWVITGTIGETGADCVVEPGQYKLFGRVTHDPSSEDVVLDCGILPVV